MKGGRLGYCNILLGRELSGRGRDQGDGLALVRAGAFGVLCTYF